MPLGSLETRPTWRNPSWAYILPVVFAGNVVVAAFGWMIVWVVTR
jgi:hypothetical protein